MWFRFLTKWRIQRRPGKDFLSLEKSLSRIQICHCLKQGIVFETDIASCSSISTDDQRWLLLHPSCLIREIGGDAWFWCTLPCHNFRQHTKIYSYYAVTKIYSYFGDYITICRWKFRKMEITRFFFLIKSERDQDVRWVNSFVSGGVSSTFWPPLCPWPSTPRILCHKRVDRGSWVVVKIF